MQNLFTFETIVPCLMSKLTNLQESCLLRKMSEGSVSAFEEIFRRHYPAVIRFLNFALSDMSLAEDKAQDIFIKIWLKRDSIQEVKSLKDFLFIASRNAALSVLRSRHTSGEMIMPAMAEDLGSGDSSSARVEFETTRTVIRDAVDSMPPVRGEVFRMSRELDMSNGQIADKLGISVRTVEKHISLALRDIRAKMS